MNILIPTFNIKASLNAFWRAVRSTPMAPYVCHAAQAPLAFDCHRYRVDPDLAKSLLGMELRGAGSAWESRRWLQPVSETVVDLSGANARLFNIYDFWSVSLIGIKFVVAATTTLLVMDFDYHPLLTAGGTAVDKLDTVNGVITAPTQASQGANKVLYRDLGNNPGEIGVIPGTSINAVVTTTVTAGTGHPFVLGFPRGETFVNGLATVGTEVFA